MKLKVTLRLFSVFKGVNPGLLLEPILKVSMQTVYQIRLLPFLRCHVLNVHRNVLLSDF